jgi:citrate lyase subunit beta / citryl-CoA lyase
MAPLPPEDLRPRRSVLYLPAFNARALEKARTLPCDAVVIDLEDSVTPEQKEAARVQALAALGQGGFGRREVVVRVNGLDTPWGEADLAALVDCPPDAVLVPKIADAGDLARYDQRLAEAPERTGLWAMVETCRVLFHLDSVAALAGATRLQALVVGGNDLAKEMRATPGPDRAPLQPALALTVAAARAHGLAALDGVFNRLEDVEGFEAECRQGRAFGFDGKTLIHPGQIDACNRVFSPSDQELAWARAVADAFAAPENAGKGVVRAAGGMAERLHLVQAERLLAAAAWDGEPRG